MLKETKGKKTKMKEFTNIQDSIGGLDIDRAEDKVVLSGRLDIPLSQEGLEEAQKLLKLAKGLVSDLELLKEKGLLDEKQALVPPVVGPNPYLKDGENEKDVPAK